MHPTTFLRLLGELASLADAAREHVHRRMLDRNFRSQKWERALASVAGAAREHVCR